MEQILTEKQESAVLSCAFALLEKTGFKVMSDECLDALERFGCAVDRARYTVRLSESVIDRVLDKARVCNPGPEAFTATGTPVGGIQPLFLERGGKPRSARTEDLLTSLRITDEIDGVTSIVPPLTNGESDSRIEPIETIALLLKTCKRPVGALDAPQPGLSSYQIRMGEIYTGIPNSTHFLSGIYCITTPLIYGERVCKTMIERAPYSIMAVPTPMPISGANTPISPHTAMAVGIAEIIAGWAIMLSLNPENPLCGLICTGSLDMATGRARFSSLEAIRQDAGVVQTLGRGCGTAIWCAHCYTDAVEPGYAAVADKYAKSLMLNQYGAGIGFHQGTLDAGKIYSNEQLAIDIELNNLLQKYAGGFSDDAEMMLDTLLEASDDPHHDWLSDPSTVENMRTIQQPLDLLRPEMAQDILARAAEKCDAALSKYTPPELPADKLLEIDKVVESARLEL